MISKEEVRLKLLDMRGKVKKVPSVEEQEEVMGGINELIEALLMDALGE